MKEILRIQGIQYFLISMAILTLCIILIIFIIFHEGPVTYYPLKDIYYTDGADYRLVIWWYSRGDINNEIHDEYLLEESKNIFSVTIEPNIFDDTNNRIFISLYRNGELIKDIDYGGQITVNHGPLRGNYIEIPNE